MFAELRNPMVDRLAESVSAVGAADSRSGFVIDTYDQWSNLPETGFSFGCWCRYDSVSEVSV